MRRSVPRRVACVRLRLAATALPLALLAGLGSAAAFPLLDSDSNVNGTRDLGAAETQDLLRQLQIASGVSAPAGGGWTFVPRIDLQALLTDNALQAHSPRRWDLATFVAPGFSLAGDLPRATVNLSYAPVLSVYARDGNLSSLTQQLNGLANVTLVPDLAYVDVRALAGVSNLYGGYGGLDALGVQTGTPASAQVTAAAAQGLNRQNETQNASFGISPYLQRRFGDWGTGRVGYSVDVARSSSLSGFASAPFPAGGLNGQTLVSQEGMARFVTGDFLGRLQDSIDLDLSQTQATTEPGFYNGLTGVRAAATTHTRSTRATVSDRLTYQVNRTLSVFGSLGREDIRYAGIGAQDINDMTWSGGATLTPNPDSFLTVSYGHQEGANSLQASGHYQVTGRTTLTLSYTTSLGTQLEYLRNQLNTAAATGSGQFVNGQTGGALLTNSNLMPQQQGVFRTEALNFGSVTSFDRDVLAFQAALTRQTQTGAGANGASTAGKIFTLSWLHQMRPDMTVSAAVSYNVQNGAGRANDFDTYFASIAWQQQISDTVGVSLRYSFFDRISPVSANNIYQSLLIAGLSKSF